MVRMSKGDKIRGERRTGGERYRRVIWMEEDKRRLTLKDFKALKSTVSASMPCLGAFGL